MVPFDFVQKRVVLLRVIGPSTLDSVPQKPQFRLNRFLHSPIKQKHVRRLARQAIDLVERDFR